MKFVIDRAKQAQVPKHVIDKAIDKAKGNTDETFTEGRYEGFGPNGSMLIVDTLTSNVNRTAANVRAAFGKNGGNMGASGSVAYLFDNKGVMSLRGTMLTASLNSCWKRMWMLMMLKQKKEASLSIQRQLTFTRLSWLCVKSGIQEFQVTELE